MALVDLTTGERRRAIDLNQNSAAKSFAGDLALDFQRGILYVADEANLRLAIADARTRRILSSLMLGHRPLAISLAPDRRSAYVAETGAVAMIDVSDSLHPKVFAEVASGDRPSSIVATDTRVYISDAANDSITVIDTRSDRMEPEIAMRIPGLEQLRGISPGGMAFDRKNGWLLVAETGINAVGVIDTKSGKVIGHIPAGWQPVRVLVDRDTVFVANARGLGGGPRTREEGSVSVYPLPTASALAGYTEYVMRSCGFLPRPAEVSALPEAVRHVVLIVEGRRSFDEVLGDVTSAMNGTVMAAPGLAHLGTEGYADGERKRLSLQLVNITPNHHAIAKHWALSDNFYADFAAEADGQLRLEADAIWNHFSNHGISLQKFDGEAELSGTARARRIIAEMEQRFGKTDSGLPQFVYVRLPNDAIGAAAPERGYPYPESATADNDNAVGMILAYLSHTRWWQQMAVFVTEAAGNGFDHLDPRRVMLLCAGPWIKRDYVSHVNTGFPGLLKTIFVLLHVPPLELSDAAASDLGNCFAGTPDFSGYQALGVDERLFKP